MTVPADRAPRELFARACRSFGQGRVGLRWKDAAGLPRTGEVASFTSLSLDPPLLLLTLEPRDQEGIGRAPFEVHLAAEEGAGDSLREAADLAVFECVATSTRLIGERALVQAEVREVRLLRPDTRPALRINGGPGWIEGAA